MLAAEYVLPLKWQDDAHLPELRAYLMRLVGWLDVTIVDGSPEHIFAAHAAAFPARVRHLRPEPWPGANGKVAGVMTGVRRARHERVVIADDDIRYEPAELRTVVQLLGDAELVRPQNYFLRLPWHARVDTARSLINRAVASDYPGTFGLRRSALLEAGGYDGDVLFENLELIRTIRAAGGREVLADDVFVGRVPPTTRHFLGQRVRQAFDDFAQPKRLVAELSLLPVVIGSGRHPRRLAAIAVLACAVAEVGRRRNHGREVFGPTAPLWAPAWVLERAVCVWIALGHRVAGGIRYADARIGTAAHPLGVLRQKVVGDDRA